MEQALVMHDREGTVLNTLEIFLSDYKLLEDQGSHPPDHAGALSGTGRYFIHWDFLIFKTFCFISSLAPW